MKDSDFADKLVNEFRSDGVVVINDVFADGECDVLMDSIVDDFVKLGTGIDKNNVEGTWVEGNLPAQTRAGLFQCLVSNFDAVWKVRANENIRMIFEVLYSSLRGKTIGEFVVSGDGLNIKPGVVGPYGGGKAKDWPHVDQTVRGDIF